MKKFGIFVFCLIFTAILLPAPTLHAAQSQIVTRRVFAAEDFNRIDANLLVSPLEIRVHQENHVLVTFEVVRDFETGNRPEFNFDSEKGTLYLTQEHSAEAVSGISIGNNGTSNMTVNVRHAGNMNMNNRQIIVDGQIAAGVNLNEISGVTFIDTGLVTVFVPENFVLDEILFESGSGRISVFGENLVTIRDVSASVTNGSVSINGAYLRNIGLTTTNGSLALSNSTADGNISMQAVNGSVSISNSRITTSPHLRVSNGSISLSDSVFTANFTTQASNGSLSWENVTAERNATATVTNGTVSISNSRIAGRLFASTTNGTINLRRIDTDMDRADIRTGRNGRAFLDGRRID